MPGLSASLRQAQRCLFAAFALAASLLFFGKAA